MWYLPLVNVDRDVALLTEAAHIVAKKARAAANTLDPLHLPTARGEALALAGYADESLHFIGNRDAQGIELATHHRTALSVGLRIMHKGLGKLADDVRETYKADDEALQERKKDLGDLFLRVRPALTDTLDEPETDEQKATALGQRDMFAEAVTEESAAQAARNRRILADEEWQASGLPLDEFIARLESPSGRVGAQLIDAARSLAATPVDALERRIAAAVEGAGALRCAAEDTHGRCDLPTGHTGDHAAEDGARWHDVDPYAPAEAVPVASPAKKQRGKGKGAATASAGQHGDGERAEVAAPSTAEKLREKLSGSRGRRMRQVPAAVEASAMEGTT